MVRAKHIIFDVDGTMYRKDIEYNPQTGSIQVAHDFFRYLAHQKLDQGIPAEEVAPSLISEYKRRIKDGTLKERVASIDASVKEEWDALVKKHGANGKAFDFHHHDLKERGIENFLHQMLAHIDFSATLDKDPQLLEIFDYLESRGYDLGILTSEVYPTVEVVAKAMGFDIDRFQVGKDPEHPDLFSETDKLYYPIICRNNSIAKPSTEGFEKVKRILDVGDSRLIAYIGDSMKKDIITSLSCGWRAVHVLNDDSPTGLKSVEVGDEKKEYTKVGNIYALRELF